MQKEELERLVLTQLAFRFNPVENTHRILVRKVGVVSWNFRFQYDVNTVVSETPTRLIVTCKFF